MRKFMMLMEDGMSSDVLGPLGVDDFELDEPEAVNVKERLENILFRLRSHSDNTGGDYSFGFESGLEMAAGMIENLLKAIEESKSGS